MPAKGRFSTLRLKVIRTLLLLSLTAGPALAQAQELPAPPGKPGHGPFPGGPPAPHGLPPLPLSFDEARNYAVRAAAVARQLQVGDVRVWPTPQGPRLGLTLTYLGRPVTNVLLRADLSFAERGGTPLLPDAAALPSVTSAERRALQQRVSALAVSGLAVVTGPQVRVTLLSQGAAVADLRFDRASGVLLAESGGREGPPGHGGQKPPRTPEK